MPALVPATKPEGARVATPARIYDLRSTFASNALAAGVTVVELARVMGPPCRPFADVEGDPQHEQTALPV